MPIKSGGFSRKSKTSSEVPSSSMADIAFLLLIFFMVSTVFQKDRDRPIEWPKTKRPHLKSSSPYIDRKKPFRQLKSH